MNIEQSLNLLLDWRQRHTDEDAGKLISFILRKGAKKTQSKKDSACKKGEHGFNIKHTGIFCGRTHWRCTNCKKSWSKLDRPMN